ncbi:hypothetical protein DP117_31465 [Brasilonema sp. UFV-L1]|nr:hypothetical protein [Brasilonema sp. UFV-L1]
MNKWVTVPPPNFEFGGLQSPEGSESDALSPDKSASPHTTIHRGDNTDQQKTGDALGQRNEPALIERVPDYANESTKTKAGSFPSRNPATADLSTCKTLAPTD